MQILCFFKFKMSNKNISLKESDVFISYGRAESKFFATKLHDSLKEKNLEVWFDQNDIPLAVDFQTQIDEGILKAKNFIFIIAPHSLKSEYCLKEVKLAVQYNKRIIPILHIEPQTKEVWDKMHPTISKLNWIYCRQRHNTSLPQAEWEFIDNYDRGLESLLKLLIQEDDYVSRHRDYLVRAVEWSRNYRMPEHLLLMELREAEIWLKTEFEHQQPPCLPCDLHCEYICESKEYFSDNQTDMFFAYSSQQKSILEKIYFAIIRKAFTIWYRDADLKAGENLLAASLEAIEKTSNFVFFISKNSINNPQILKELEYAGKLNKRIIPILTDDSEEKDFPEAIKKIYYLDFKDQTNFAKSIEKFINLINKNYLEFDLHKQILVSALEWERNNMEVKYLLRGFKLESAKQWLENANIRKEYSPTSLQKKYIEDSRKTTITAFISYARTPSKEFATKLYTELSQRNFDIWFDQNNIPLAVDFQEQINNGIEKSDNFIFVISPNSIKSQYCKLEVELAIKYNKRIIPILHVLPTENIKDMNEVIAKLNWIYFREDQDDFQKSMNGLIQVMESHPKYLKLHTNILISALEWQRNRYNEKYLIADKKLFEAEKWLSIKFTDEQPPTIPTNLHLDYILKSRKNVNNQYTDVFFIYTEEESEIRDKIYFELARNGITAADNNDYTGDFMEANHLAIERADSIIYFVSKKSIKTEYCLEEAQHALLFEKRIIVVMLEKIERSELIEELAELETIDLTSPERFKHAIDGLTANINHDKNYHFLHKKYLSMAIEWKKQNSIKSLLLNNYEFEKAKIWLAEATQRPKYVETPLHQQFITASESEISNFSPEIYLSYSERESDFARKLNYKLQISGKFVWNNAENIYKTEDFFNIIKEAIRNSDNIIFVYSSNLTTQKHFEDELKLAKELGKRIIVLEYETLPEEEKNKFDNANIVYFNPENTDFNISFSELTRYLDADREHVQAHNKWGKRAGEWIESKKADDLLLRGVELNAANDWLKDASEKNKNPRPTESHKEFLARSNKFKDKTSRREKRWNFIKKTGAVLISILFVVSLILGVIAKRQTQKTEELLKEANIQRLYYIAYDQINTNPTKSMRLIEYSLQLENNIKTLNFFNQIYYNNILYQNILDLDQKPNYMEISPDDKLYAIVTGNIATIYDTDNKEVTKLVGHTAVINNLSFSKDSKQILTASDDKTVIRWDLKGTILQEYECNSNAILAVRFSPDDKYFLTANGDYSAKLWDMDGNLIRTFQGHQSAVWDADFSDDGKYIVTCSSDQTTIVWNIEGKKLQTFTEENNMFRYVDFAPNGKHILTTTTDGKAQIWNTEGKKVFTFEITNNSIISACFSRNGNKIITCCTDNTILLWNMNFDIVATLRGHSSEAHFARTNSEETILYSCGNDKTLKRWYLNGIEEYQIKTNLDASLLKKLNDSIFILNNNKFLVRLNILNQDIKQYSAHKSQITSIDISKDKKYILSGDADRNVILWDSEMKVIKNINHHQDDITVVKFAPDNKHFFTVSQDFVIAMWSITGELVKNIDTEYTVLDLDFSHDGKYFITANEDRTATLWTIEGEAIKTFHRHKGMVNKVACSPDSNIFITACTDNIIRLWNFDGQLLHSTKLHVEKITDIKFTHDGKHFISCAEDKKLTIFDINATPLKTYSPEYCKSIEIEDHNFFTITENGTFYKRNIKMDYAEFIQKFQYQEMNIADKVEYKLVTTDDILNIQDLEQAIILAEYYKLQAEEETDMEIKIDLQNKAIEYLETMLDKDDYKNDKKLIKTISDMWSELSYYYILTEKYSSALNYAKKAFDIAEDKTPTVANLALAYFLNEDHENYKKIYLSFKDSEYDNKKFSDIFNEGLQNLEDNGIQNENLTQIKKWIKGF